MDGHRALPGCLRVVEAPLPEHPRVALYGREGGAQLVAGVGDEAPLANESLLPARESGLQAGEEVVYGGGEAAYLVLRVFDGQAFGEVPRGDPAGGADDSFHGRERSARQEI